MISYTQTQVYVDMHGHLRRQLAYDVHERCVLQGVLRSARSDVEQRRFQQLGRRVKRHEELLARLEGLDVSDWQLLHLLMAADGSLWTNDEITLWYASREGHEGGGEKALKLRHELPLKSTYRAGDLVNWVGDVRVLYEEVKKLEGPGDRLQDIQTGEVGRQLYADWSHAWYHAYRANLAPQLLAAFRHGTLTSRSIRELPVYLQADLRSTLSAAAVIGGYDAINGCTRHGFLRVPKVDCDVAWELSRVARGVPHFKLCRAYLLGRLKVSAPQQQAHVLPQQRLGMGLGLASGQ